MRKEGLTFAGMVSSVLVALKLSGLIDWSWWLVLLPVYFSPLILLLMVFVYIMNKGAEELLEDLERSDDDWNI